MQLSSQALRRRARSYLRKHQLDLFVAVLPGFEDVAAAELRSIGYAPSVERGGLHLHGNIDAVYRTNLVHRTASRVLIRIDDFLAQTYPMLHNHTMRVAWEVFLGNCLDLQFNVTFRSSRLRNAAHIAAVLRQAIDSRLGRFGLGPSRVGGEGLVVHARLFRDRCLLSLDTTGVHLHRRGYRTEAYRAPIRETTAAGILEVAGAATYDVVVDPFCGSGTFCIEAELLARNAPPNLQRVLPVKHSPLHSAGAFAESKRWAVRQTHVSTIDRIFGFDINPTAVDVARRSAHHAATSIVEVSQGDALAIEFDRLLNPDEKGLIVCNLPYGKRLGTVSSSSRLIAQFLATLRKAAMQWHFAIIVPEATVVNAAGLNVERVIHFNNGGLHVDAVFGHAN